VRTSSCRSRSDERAPQGPEAARLDTPRLWAQPRTACDRGLAPTYNALRLHSTLAACPRLSTSFATLQRAWQPRPADRQAKWGSQTPVFTLCGAPYGAEKPLWRSARFAVPILSSPGRYQPGDGGRVATEPATPAYVGRARCRRRRGHRAGPASIADGLRSVSNQTGVLHKFAGHKPIRVSYCDCSTSSLHCSGVGRHAGPWGGRRGSTPAFGMPSA